MKLSRVAFIFGSVQQVSQANGENILRGINLFTSAKTQEGGRCKGLIQVSDNRDSPDRLSPVCMLDDGTIVSIVGRESSFWEEKMESGEFRSGETQVSGCEFVPSFEGGGPVECFIPPGDSSQFLFNVVNKNANNQEENERRNFTTVTGDRTILVVRVIADNQATTALEGSLTSGVFDDSVNVAKQYKACSHGKLNFVKADGRSLTGINDGGETDISRGVTTVRVNVSTSQGDAAMRNAITAALNENFGVSSPAALADHVMYCLPAGTMHGIAYAMIGSWMSVYSDQWCESLSGQMHEIGHNLGLAHANEKGSYKDQTGMMGYSYFTTDGPKMCFNAAKSWQLGWYADKAVTLDKNNRGYVGVLGGIADYSGSNNIVLVKLNTGTSTDYYVNFNRKSGINSGTVEGGNRVTIVKGPGEGTGYVESELVAKLSKGKTYTIKNFDGTGEKATIKVHNIGATALVSICIGRCPAPTRPPTQSPTKSATPSSSPSLAPSQTPSKSATPSSSPSLAPSQTPSKSLTPSSSPSLAPSQTPSKSLTPSSSPSLGPSQTPSESLTPSSSPTQECLDSPTWRMTVRNRKRRQKKGCNWVKGKKHRCGKVGTGKVAAIDACPVACGNCPA